MRRLPIILACLLGAALAGADAQQQEKTLAERINAKPDMSLVNPMQSQSYGSGTYGTKTFGSTSYGAVKNADVKPFETRSFLGFKNPWIGKKIFDTSASSYTKQTDREFSDKFATAAYTTSQFSKGGKPDLRDTGTPLSADVQPRPYLVAGKTQQGLDRFTQNLQKDLTIDDVRDLLNKGKGE